MMTQKDKELLLKDLSARLPYGVKIHINSPIEEQNSMELFDVNLDSEHIGVGNEKWVFRAIPIIDEEDETKVIKPYLRPLSSMTEEERKELEKITHHTFEYKKGERDIWTKNYHKYHLFNGAGNLYGAGEPINMLCSSELCTKLIDWLNMHHFDYKHLIERGLALEAPEGMYNIKKK